MTTISTLQRFTALTLALLMFLTSMVFVVDVHYCGGHVKSLNFFGKAKACYEVSDAQKKCPNHQNQAVSHEVDKKNCCNNQSFQFQADQDQATPSASFIISPQFQQFITAYVSTFLTSTYIIQAEQPAFIHYKPPRIVQDIPVLIQSFLL